MAIGLIAAGVLGSSAFRVVRKMGDVIVGQASFEAYAKRAKERFGLRLTDFIEAKRGIIPEIGWMGVTEVRRGGVKAVAPPDNESVLHEGVHAFFREKEIENGILEQEMTYPSVEEITAYVVSKTIVGNPFKVCTVEERGRVEGELEAYRYEELKKTHPEMAREMRIEDALVAGCVFPEDVEFVEKVKGADPKTVYNAVASQLGYPKLEEVWMGNFLEEGSEQLGDDKATATARHNL